MKIFKFGGASVKNAEAIKNISAIINHYSNESIVIVISAIDKTTTALENLTEKYYNNDFY